MNPNLWGEGLALQLIRGLAKHRVQGIELTKLEPDLDPFCHHTNMPIAIVFQHVIGNVGWPHIVGLVEGSFVQVDQPIPNTHRRTHVTSDADVARVIAELDVAASRWVAGGHERLGMMDAGLAAMVLLRRRGQPCWLHLDSTVARISARRGTHRWPPTLQLAVTGAGIEVTCGASTRVIKTLEQLMGEFDREATEFAAQVARCEAFAADTERARAIAKAVHGVLAGRLMDHAWTMSARLDGGHFALDERPIIYLEGRGKTSTMVWCEAKVDGVEVSCNGGYTRTVTSEAGVRKHDDELVAAVKTALAFVTSATLVEGSRYRVKKPFGTASTGDILTFDCIEDQRFSNAWKWKGPNGWVYLGEEEPELARLSEYLEPA